MPADTTTEPIVKELRIDASPETVFAFFTEPELITRWLAVEADLDPRPGGRCWQTHVDDGVRYLMRGEFARPPRPDRRPRPPRPRLGRDAAPPRGRRVAAGARAPAGSLTA